MNIDDVIRDETYVYTHGPSFSKGELVLMGGDVHLAADAENLLCNGAVLEAASTEGDANLRWRKTPRKRLTCLDCIRVVELCVAYDKQPKRSVRTKA